MSSFDGVSFKVLAVNENWFPNFEMDEEGKYVYRCRAFFSDLASRQAMAGKVTIATYRRTLGTLATTVHVDVGTGKGTLTVPLAGGVNMAVIAILDSMTNVEGYGLYANKGYLADLSFVITSNPLG
jgi:hypothetical protein